MKTTLLLLTASAATTLAASTLAGCGSPPVVTLAEFNSLQTGMSYSQAASAIGAEGEVASTTTMPGVPGIMESTTTTIYMWKNADGSNMNAMFQNDRLITKAQAGLS